MSTVSIPRYECLVYVPVVTSDGNSRSIVSEEIAKPRPWEPWTTAVVTPTTNPFALSSGPPELPGLIGLLIWITSAMGNVALPVDDPYCTLLPTWLTIPVVIEPEYPYGFPIAATGSPIWRDEEEVS